MNAYETITKASQGVEFACSDLQQYGQFGSVEAIVVEGLHKRAVELQRDLERFALALSSEVQEEEKSVEDTMELNEAFERVRSKDDWRTPINYVVIEPDEKKRQKIVEAIEFYTATKATVTHVTGDRYRFQADGYRQGPAGP